jgi:hypothetical protein
MRQTPVTGLVLGVLFCPLFYLPHQSLEGHETVKPLLGLYSLFD